MKAIVIEKNGGPDELRLADTQKPQPEIGQVLVEVAAAGVNFMDIGVRSGMFWREKSLPFVPGVEGAGRVTALGQGVETLRVGERVAWVYAPGSYAEEVAVPADALVPIPDSIDDQTAASLMMQGLTASFFATEFYPIKLGDIALVHAAAGGVGTLLTQIIKLRGGVVIGRVSTEEKAETAKMAGADHVIIESSGTFAAEVMRLTNNEGVHVVYDGSGVVTFDDSIASLRRHGVLAYYGPVLGRLKPVDLVTLPRSILIGYPTFFDHIPTHELLLARSRQLFDWVESGKLKVNISHRYPLADAVQAHRDLESRSTTGKLLLIP